MIPNNVKNLNSVYSLCKDKITGKWQVGEWANQALWSVDGKNNRICSFTQMTQWKYFTEALEYTAKTDSLMRGEKVVIEGPDKRTSLYFVVDFIREEDGKFVYLVGA